MLLFKEDFIFLFSRKHVNTKINIAHACTLAEGGLHLSDKTCCRGAHLLLMAEKGAAGWASWKWVPEVTQVLHLVGLQSWFTAVLSPS